MPAIADHCIDQSEEFYLSAGVSRLHDLPFMNPSQVKQNDIVFVKVDAIYEGYFQKEVLPFIDNEFTLISGIGSYGIGLNGDRSYLELVESPKVKKWFCTNPPKDNSGKIIPLPIGFEEREREGGDQKLLKEIWNNHKTWKDKKDVFYLPYHTIGNNPIRDNHIDYLKTLDFVYVESEKLPFAEYMKRMDDYKFIICLEGSGFDTHRNYEALLVESVPIMIDSSIRGVYELDNLPSIFVSDWRELNGRAFTDAMNSNYTFSFVSDFLTVDHHVERIKKYAKS